MSYSLKIDDEKEDKFYNPSSILLLALKIVGVITILGVV